MDVSSTVPMKYFNYQVLGRGDVLIGGTIAVPDRMSHTFRFPASFAMVPRARLLVYFIHSDGQMISDFAEIEFASELQNFVSISIGFSQDTP